MFKQLRIALLLLVLATVALGTWRDKVRATAWQSSLRVAIYPIAADDSAAARAYIETLSDASFEDIEAWFVSQTQGYGVTVSPPVQLSLAPRVGASPPAPPRGGNALAIAWWSLQLRYWSWRHDQTPKPRPQVKLYVLFHDPATTLSVPHSLGLEKGMIGVVHAFASGAQALQNNVVIAHELLHTLGATDKYDLATNQPRHPEGYAQPQREPLLPQLQAEIMAGRIPVTATQARMPQSLADTVLGPATAGEIGLAQRAR